MFTRSGGICSQQNKLTATDGKRFDRPAVSDDGTTVVGAAYGAGSGLDSPGAAYFYNTSDLEP